MTPRPYFNASIADLEAEFRRYQDDPKQLRVLVHELGFRTIQWALRLKSQVERRLVQLSREVGASVVPRVSAPEPRPPVAGVGRSGTPPAPAPPRGPAQLPPRDPEPVARPPLLVRRPVPAPPTPPVSNRPESVVDAWTALEVLSPQSFRKPHDLAAGGDRRLVAPLDQPRLPWEKGENARPRTRLYYQIVLGSIDLEAAVRQLLAVYVDGRAERPPARGETILAVVVVDREGRPVEDGCAVSSFGWGVPRALRGDLAGLAEWSAAERALVERLSERLRLQDEDGEVLPLDRTRIDAAFYWLSGTLGLPPELVSPPRFAIRTYEYFKEPAPPAPLLLNSFFLGDLSVARALFADGGATANLRRYVGAVAPRERSDLLHDRAALEEAVAPAATPPGRWPGPGRHPLVLLQQAAVNLAMRLGEADGIVAVNGPPGTGKTTLLRDVVAALVVARAERMAMFERPETAFLSTGQRIRAGQGWLHLYRLDPRLKGFEMLVASSNNKAVENVSAELPGLQSVAGDAGELRYFQLLSDELHERETWGLVAAVLGNAANRNRFRRTFWWDRDVGLATYLAAAAGTPQTFQVPSPASGEPRQRPPRIVTAEDAPFSPAEALARWQSARRAFRAAMEKSRNALAALEDARRSARELPALASAESTASAMLALERSALRRAADERAGAEAALRQARQDAGATERRLSEHDTGRPGFLARLFSTRRARVWKAARAVLARAHDQASRALTAAAQHHAAREQAAAQARSNVEAAEAALRRAADAHARARLAVEAARERIGNRFADEAFFGRGHEELHTATPWLADTDQRRRDDVFEAAMQLHRAFIDAAARPLRHNLGVLMNAMGGGGLPTPEKQALLPDLWRSLFLVVSLVSTTFASVERMLGGLPPESLGWLLVDEAGQALPQAAVGALMRTRRAVVVGDPMQIEPIVTLPKSLTQSICRHFGVDPDRFNAPEASVQTLADAATPYVAEFEGRFGSRTVGVPLLVHRRCEHPMFTVSNSIAYNGLMVNAKTACPSAVRDVLGPSAWIDVTGSAEEKWCPEEGEAVLELLSRLAAAGVVPDLYIVTPFVVVAEQLRRNVRDSGVLAGWTDDPGRWTLERIGTVHTVQGREAEAVIFVLGAPAAEQSGARNWAGYPPNLLNVAITRAKEQLYVVGNRRLWRQAGLFTELDAQLP